MSNNYTFKTAALKSTTADVTKLSVKKEGEFNDILDIIPSVKDANKDIDYNIPPKIEFLGKYVNVVPVTDANNKLVTLQVYIQENRNYQGLTSSITTDGASPSTIYIFDNGATKPVSTYNWGSSYTKGSSSIISKGADTGWGTISITAGATGDSTHHGSTKGFALPNLDTKIRVTVYADNDSITKVSETPIIKTSGDFAGSSDVTDTVTISGTAKVLGEEVASEGRSPNTVEITGFTVTIDPHGILDENKGGSIRYRIDLVEGEKVTKVYERTAADYLFYGVCSTSSVTLTATNQTPKTRTVCGTSYNIEGSKVTINAANGSGFTGGARNSLNLWTLSPNKGTAETRSYDEVSHTALNTDDDIVSDNYVVTFTGKGFAGTYSVAVSLYDGSGTSTSSIKPTGFSSIFTNVWANPSTASSSTTENFADSDAADTTTGATKTLRLNPDYTTNWSWNASTQAKCTPNTSNGKGILKAGNTSSATEHLRLINNTNTKSYSNFEMTFDTASAWTDWSKVRVLCATKANTDTWYAVNFKANTYTTDGYRGISNNDISDSLKTFSCSFPTGVNTPGKDGIYIKIVIPKDSTAAVYPYSVTFK